jgi:hypothetical protein
MGVTLSTGFTHRRMLAACCMTVTGVLAALGVVGTGIARADIVVPLPDGVNALTTATGIKVDLRRTGETATVSPSLAANGMTRTAWVSGTDMATVTGATSGALEAGYLVGCQVDLSGGVSAGGDIWVSPPDSLSPELTTNFTIKPGQVATVKLGTKPLTPRAGKVGFAYRNLNIQVDGCGGYAEARSYAKLTVVNATGSTVVTLYGKPFSLG